MTPLIAAILLLAADATLVHRCVGGDGVPRYQDEPCAAGEAQQQLELKLPAPTSTPIAVGVPGTIAPEDAADGRSAAPPSPVPMSWRCEVDNGEVYYRHDGCPEVISEPLWLTMPDRSGYSTWMRVRAVPVQRSFACSAITRGGRFGAERDQRASPYEKLSGRDLCR